MSRALPQAPRAEARRRAALCAALLVALTSPAAFADDPPAVVPAAGGSSISGSAPGLAPVSNCEELLEHAAPAPPSLEPPSRPEARLEARQEARPGARPEAGGPPALAKTDGRVLVSVDHGRLRVFDVSGGAPVARGALDLGPVAPTDLFLAGSRALVLGDVQLPSAGTGAAEVAMSVVDLADPTRPRVVSARALTGRQVAARLSHGVLRVVLAAAAPHARPARAEDWLPSSRPLDGASGAAPARSLVRCPDVLRAAGAHRAAGAAAPALLTVLALDLRAVGAAGPAVTAVLADAGSAYLAPGHLYVATTRDGASTVHAFETAGRAGSAYAASGSLDGRVPGGWAMSEHAGVLRVLAERAGGRGQEMDLVALRREGVALVQAGRLRDAGAGEAVQAVRWFGEGAAVVTMPHLHTLRMLDLSDPARPARRGTLQVPWCEDQLRPLGDFRLLGLGSAAGLGPARLQVSAYDVIDPDAPRPTAAVRYGSTHSSSSAETDPRQLVYLRSRQIAVFPASWRLHRSAACARGRCPTDIDSGRFNGLVAVRVGPDGTLSRAGRWRSTGAAAGAWSSGYPSLTAVALSRGRLAALDGRGLTVLDADGLTVRGFAAHPVPGR